MGVGFGLTLSGHRADCLTMTLAWDLAYRIPFGANMGRLGFGG
jgi:hypothetical protein